jgi:Mo-co oxidoreductase dimerisation domain.
MGTDFIVPTRSRIDVPDDWAFVSLSKLTAPIEVKGIAFGGDRGISRVELSFDDGQTGATRRFITPAAIWRGHSGKHSGPPPRRVITSGRSCHDGEGDVQEWEEDRGPFSGVSGLHRINVRVTA